MNSIITAELVDLQIQATDYQEAILKLARKIEGLERLNNFEGYYESVLEREELTSTGIGFGIAIPHGKCEHVKQTTVAFGRLNQAIDWNSLDGGQVQIVFLLAVPEACKGDEHLRIIANLSRKLVHEEFRAQLAHVTSEQEIVDLLSDSLTSAVA